MWYSGDLLLGGMKGARHPTPQHLLAAMSTLTAHTMRGCDTCFDGCPSHFSAHSRSHDLGIHPHNISQF